jgi:hypothetical protein
MKSKYGLILAGIYILIAVFLIATQGLFGESFIAIILGLPWVLLFSLVEFGGVEGAMMYVLILTPMVLNAILLYLIGWFFERRQTSGAQV